MLTTKRPVLSEASDPSENVQTAFRKPSVIIVGGGFCGAALAINLLRKAQRPLQVVLVEPRPALGQGVAYNTGDPLHLLNVPADNMSAFVDDSGHFQDWLARQAGVLGPFFQADGGSFLPRYVYGQYIRDTLETSVEKARPGVTFASIQAEASKVEPATKGMRVRLTNGRTLDANAVVLALGNLPPRALPHISTELAQTGCYQADPWGGGVLEGLNVNDDLLIVGTGLTMVDLVVSLHSRGHRGRIYPLPRRGLLPQAHPPRSRCDSPVLHPFVTELEQNPPNYFYIGQEGARYCQNAHPPWGRMAGGSRQPSTHLPASLAQPGGSREDALSEPRPSLLGGTPSPHRTPDSRHRKCMSGGEPAQSFDRPTS